MHITKKSAHEEQPKTKEPVLIPRIEISKVPEIINEKL